MATYPIEEKKVNRSSLVLFFLAFVFVNAFVYYFISRERYIYFWDYYNYWGKYRYLGSLLLHSPLKTFSEVWHTMRYDDYNLLAVLPLMPVRLIFGAGRLAYILAVANVYVLPSAMLCALLVKKLIDSKNQRESYIAVFAGLFTLLLFPQFWVPVFLGYPDAVGVVIIFVILSVLSHKQVEEMPARTLLCLGLLFAFFVLLRRWYAYWVVSFFFGLAAERSVAFLSRTPLDLKRYVSAVRNTIVIGIASAALFLALADPLASKMISTNYSDIYSAYKSAHTLFQVAGEFYLYFGPLLTTLFIIGLSYCLWNGRTRLFFLFIFVQFICIVILFSRVQDFSIHHLYLLMPSMILAISVAVAGLLSGVKDELLKLFLAAGYSVMLGLQILVVFVPGAAADVSRITPLFTKFRHYPLMRNDLGTIARMLDVLAERTRDSDKIYVLASSIIFNDDILRNACISFNKAQILCDNILVSAHVDKRDGFPKNFLSAGYVVVAEPLQYHLRPEDQRVVGILAAQMHLTSGIGSSFEALSNEFLLDNNVRVRIYKKVKPFAPAALRQLEDLYAAYYPDKKGMFAIPEADKRVE